MRVLIIENARGCGGENMDKTTEQMWATLKIELKFAPNTGSIKPWEVYGVFTYPHRSRVHWASFKTEAAARKRIAKLCQKYPQAASNP